MIVSVLGIGLTLVLVFLFDLSRIEDPWQIMIFGQLNKLGRNIQGFLPQEKCEFPIKYMNHILIRLSRRDLEKNKKLLLINKLTTLTMGIYLVAIVWAVKRVLTPELIAMSTLFVFVMWLMPDLQARKVSKAKMDQMEHAFSEFLLKYIILVEAGMNLDKIYRMILENHEPGENKNVFYLELAYFLVDLDSGLGLSEAARKFSHNTRFPLMNKFSQIIIQSHEYGSEELSTRLSILLIDTFETEKKRVKARCEEAVTKLVFPTMLLMIAIMIIIIFPGIYSIL